MKRDNLLKEASEMKKVDEVLISAWYGIRYATATTRFLAATAVSDRLDVSRLKDVPIFPQFPSKLAAVMGQGEINPQSEDAFFLNIWAPTDANDLPVVFFIHGGAWMTGGGSMGWYDGSKLAARGLVVVNVNYRLGPLGHMGHSEAHDLPLPAADLLLALRWVVDHVHLLGGDSKKITVMGQSAGGWYAHLLSVLEETRGLVNRVALFSMGTRTPWTPETQLETTNRANRILQGKINTAPVNEVLKAGIEALEREPARLGHGPAAFLPVASSALPKDLLEPGWAAQACHADAVYLHYTADESSTFLFNIDAQTQATQKQVDVALGQWSLRDLPPQLQLNGLFDGVSSGLSPYRQLVAASSWRQFQRFPVEYAEALSRREHPVKLTCFEIESPLARLHSGHCFDLPFLFGNRWAWYDAPMLETFDQARFDKDSDALITEVSDFVKGSASR